MRNSKIALVIALLTVTLVGDAQAFDGDRKGFILNLGAGFGKGELKISDDSNSISGDDTGFSTNFKIGVGLSEQSMLYYSNNVIWWSTGTVNFLTGMSAVGYSYFFSAQAPSFFLNGSIGLGFAQIEDLDGESGAGVGFGAGYEFAKNWTFEVNYNSAKLAEVADVKLTTSNVSVTISWFAY